LINRLLLILVLLFLISPPARSAASAQPFLALPFANGSSVKVYTYEGHGTAWDFGLSEGTTILAPANGKVIAARNWTSETWGEKVKTSGCSTTDDYGNYIILEHAGGYRTLYAHLKKDSFMEEILGHSVQQGQPIAQSGTTGCSTGPHLHFEVRLNNAGVDPYDSNAWLWLTRPPTSPSQSPVSISPQVKISGNVFQDLNRDGQQNGSERGIAGVSVRTIGAVDNRTATTDSAGNYTISLNDGQTYTIGVDIPQGYEISPSTPPLSAPKRPLNFGLVPLLQWTVPASNISTQASLDVIAYSPLAAAQSGFTSVDFMTQSGNRWTSGCSSGPMVPLGGVPGTDFRCQIPASSLQSGSNTLCFDVHFNGGATMNCAGGTRIVTKASNNSPGGGTQFPTPNLGPDNQAPPSAQLKSPTPAPIKQPTANIGNGPSIANTPTPRPAQQYSMTLTTNATQYRPGDTIGFCYRLTPQNIPYHVRFLNQGSVIREWEDNGVNGGDCAEVAVSATSTGGQRRLTVEAYVNGGKVAEASATINIIVSADRDRDGYPDNSDECPDHGGNVDEVGCPIQAPPPPVGLPAWKLCDGQNYSGACITVNSDVPNLATLGFDNRISSVVAPSSGSCISLYTDPNYVSPPGALGLRPGQSTSNFNSLGFMENSISSVKVYAC
jgi:hypothetical protein